MGIPVVACPKTIDNDLSAHGSYIGLTPRCRRHADGSTASTPRPNRTAGAVVIEVMAVMKGDCHALGVAGGAESFCYRRYRLPSNPCANACATSGLRKKKFSWAVVVAEGAKLPARTRR